jgi:DNA invertase Pin-like site-specific DNA recombinase
VLIVSELSRLGREQHATQRAVSQHIDAGVQIWCYLDDRRLRAETAIDAFMVGVEAFAAEIEQKARHRSDDSGLRRPGPVTSLAAASLGIATST